MRDGTTVRRAFAVVKFPTPGMHITHVVINMSRVTVAGKALFRTVHELDAQLKRRGGRLYIRGASEAMTHALADDRLSVAELVTVYLASRREVDSRV